MSILRPSALPDETAKGIKGRVLRLNGWTSERDAMQSLHKWASAECPTSEQFCLVELLAKVVGVDITRFVRDHTTLPFRRSVVSTQADVPHGSSSHRSLLEKRALCDARPSAYFCKECVKEDCDFHGTAYWRRSHQLPGVFWCQKHGSALSIAASTSAMLSSPTEFFEECEDVSAEWVKSLKENEAIRNFLAISNDLMMRDRPLDELYVSRAVRARWQEFQSQDPEKRAQLQPRLSDLIRSSFDVKWLSKVSLHAGRKPGQLWKTLDRTTGGMQACANSVGYALIFATLYASSDEAVNAMVDSQVKFSDAGALENARSNPIDDRLRSVYFTVGGSHIEVADKLGLPRSQVKRRLKALGLPPLGRNDIDKFEGVINLLMEGETTLTQACAAHGLTLCDMKHRLGDALNPLLTTLTQLRSNSAIRNPGRKRPVGQRKHEREATAKASI